MSQQQDQGTASVDGTLVDPANAPDNDVEPADVPDEIRWITAGLASRQPPTNPLVVLQAARWWFVHGKGVSDPAFQWALEWALHLATETPSDVERFDDFLEHLVGLGFVDEKVALRQPPE